MADTDDTGTTTTTTATATDNGAKPADPPNGGTTDSADAADDAGAALGDAGRQALERERRDAAAARKEAKALARRIEELERERLDGTERAVAEATAKARAEALGEVGRRLVEAEARAAAAGVLRNPELAAKLLDLDDLTPDDGAVDSAAIAAAVAKLAKDYPELAALPATVEAPEVKRGTVEGGARGGTPTTFTRSQLRDPAFYEANKDAILAAAREGRITND